MSQLRKLHRHVRPRVAIDLETLPLRGPYGGRIESVNIAGTDYVVLEAAVTCPPAYRANPTGREPSKPEIIPLPSLPPAKTSLSWRDAFREPLFTEADFAELERRMLEGMSAHERLEFEVLGDPFHTEPGAEE